MTGDLSFSARQKLLLIPVYTLLVMAAAVTLVPFFWMACAAFKGNADFFSSVFLPRGDGFLGIAWDRLTVVNFKRLFTELSIGNALANSFFLSSVCALLATLCAAAGGYALAKFRFAGRGVVLNLVLVALVIPGPLLMAPGYQLIYKLGLLDTYAGLILPGIAPAFGIFLFRQATLNAIPHELLESARIDGAGELRIFFTLVLPLLRPMIGAFLMITFLGTWNNFIGPQIILQSPELFPLSVAINQLRGLYGQDYGMIMSGTLVLSSVSAAGAANLLNSRVRAGDTANAGLFTITSLGANSSAISLTASAIPEPSSYAALAGVAMLGFAAGRRRRA